MKYGLTYRHDPRTLRLSDYLDPKLVLPQVPADFHGWQVKMDRSMVPMDGNDKYGCCVEAMMMHAIATYTFNATGAAAIATTDETLALYSAITGFSPDDPTTDNGTEFTAALKYWRNHGVPIGGGIHKINSFVSVNYHNWDELRAAAYLFGGICWGVEVPKDWEQSKTWGPSSSQIVGGHGIYSPYVGFRGAQIDSWGELNYLLTKPAVPLNTIACFAVLGPDWADANKKAPNGFDYATLQADLSTVTA